LVVDVNRVACNIDEDGSADVHDGRRRRCGGPR
jgi:hypothetical protein